MSLVILLTVFVVAMCSMVYHLIFGTLVSYFDGNSMIQYSVTLGLYFCAMGVGALLTPVSGSILLMLSLLWKCLQVCLEVVRGFFLLVSSFVHSHTWILHVFLGFTGICVGVEIPLLIILLKQKTQLKKLVTHVYSIVI